MSGGRARLAGVANAPAVPNAITSAKIGAVEVGCVPEYQARAPTLSAWRARPVAASRRRSTRSASVPVTNTSTAAGANSANPSRPRSSARPVRSKTCLPSTVVRSATAAAEQNTDESSARKERVWRGCTRFILVSSPRVRAAPPAAAIT